MKFFFLSFKICHPMKDFLIQFFLKIFVMTKVPWYLFLELIKVGLIPTFSF